MKVSCIKLQPEDEKILPVTITMNCSDKILPANMGCHENRISNVYISLAQYGDYVVRSDGREKQPTYNCLVTREEKPAAFEIGSCKQRQEKMVCA